MTVEQFATLDPGYGKINLYHSGYVVSAVNVDNISSNGVNISSALAELEKITIQISGVNYTADILIASIQTGYYHYRVTPFTVSSTADINTATITRLTPGISQINFGKSNYQALKNNASTGRSTSFIFDVDRRSTQLLPLNYQAIISGSATPAQYQELNYSSIGISNSRYSGTKTVKTLDTYRISGATGSIDYKPYKDSILPYGVDPAISGTPFEAASYLSSSNNSFIISQSLSDRDIETYLFDGTTETPVVGSNVFTLEGNKVLPIKNKKVWVKDSREVVYLNNDGIVESIN